MERSIEFYFKKLGEAVLPAAALSLALTTPVLAESGIPVDNGSVNNEQSYTVSCQPGATAYVISLGYGHFAKMIFNPDCTLNQEEPFMVVITCTSQTTQEYDDRGRLKFSHISQTCTTPMMPYEPPFYPSPSEPVPEPQPEFPA